MNRCQPSYRRRPVFRPCEIPGFRLPPAFAGIAWNDDDRITLRTLETERWMGMPKGRLRRVLFLSVTRGEGIPLAMEMVHSEMAVP